MKESSQIAWSYLQSHLKELLPGKAFFKKKNVHIHLPEGAVPKDGPSAGITMVTALISLLLKKPVNHGLAMTGELTLTGKILPIGGLKEKIIAARRADVRTIIIPEENNKDLNELPAEIKKGLKFVAVSNYKQVFKEAFK